MGSYGKYRLILLLFVVFAAYSNLEKTDAQAGEKTDSYTHNEIRDALSSKKDMIRFSRASGLLSSLLREQKRLFTSTKGTGKNEAALKIEGLLNEAAMFASSKNYDDAYIILHNAHEVVSKSLEELAPKQK